MGSWLFCFNPRLCFDKKKKTVLEVLGLYALVEDGRFSLNVVELTLFDSKLLVDIGLNASR